MGEKYGEYVGRAHLAKESIKKAWSNVRDTNGPLNSLKEGVIQKINHGDNQYDHLYRRKTRWELTRISAAVMGIEFSYAAETAFVSPTLLKIGVLHKHMTLIWCLSPLVGFFLTPILGSLSDRCRSNLGRRRPFIILLSIGVVLGLTLVPNGKWLGKKMGDVYPNEDAYESWKQSLARNQSRISFAKTPVVGGDDEGDDAGPGGRLVGTGSWQQPKPRLVLDDDEEGLEEDDQDYSEDNVTISIRTSTRRPKVLRRIRTLKPSVRTLDKAEKSDQDNKDEDEEDDEDGSESSSTAYSDHPWGIFFTILGTVLLDFDADACQSPSRAYLLDVTVAEDHAIGLSTFTIMAGLGGSLGYAMGGFNWGALGRLFGGHVRLVFILVLFIFIGCVYITLTSFAEMPLDILAAATYSKQNLEEGRRRRSSLYRHLKSEQAGLEENVPMGQIEGAQAPAYGSMEFKPANRGNPFTTEASQDDVTYPNGHVFEEERKFLQVAETSFNQASPMPVEEGEEAKASIATLTEYLWSIIYMPRSLRMLCLTNFFCWSSLVCYSLYFTDFVGEAVFQGNPAADPGTKERQLYDDGVRFGCWGMALYSLSCSCYSFIIEKLVKRFRAKRVYIVGQLIYCVGMIFMALCRSKWGVLLFSWSAGVMYSTLFTMPYLLVAHYHETDKIQCEDVWILRQIRMLVARRRNEANDEDQQRKEDEAMALRKKIIESQARGLGTDVGIVSSMVFLAQFVLSLSMGSIINAVQSTTAVVVAASVLSFCGAISANFVTYLDL